MPEAPAADRRADACRVRTDRTANPHATQPRHKTPAVMLVGASLSEVKRWLVTRLGYGRLRFPTRHGVTAWSASHRSTSPQEPTWRPRRRRLGPVPR